MKHIQIQAACYHDCTVQETFGETIAQATLAKISSEQAEMLATYQFFFL